MFIVSVILFPSSVCFIKLSFFFFLFCFLYVNYVSIKLDKKRVSVDGETVGEEMREEG